MNLKLITAPAKEPVRVQEAKTQLNVRDDLSDELIQRHISEARQWAEQFTGRSFITQTWEAVLDAWPQDNVIALPRGNVQSITSVKYIDAAGVQQTIANTEYKLASAGLMQRLVPAYGKEWPTAREEIEAIAVRYVAGYGANEDDVPGPIREGILITVGHWLEHRAAIESGARITRIPYAVEHMMATYRILGI